jgi:hypothetical protein
MTDSRANLTGCSRRIVRQVKSQGDDEILEPETYAAVACAAPSQNGRQHSHRVRAVGIAYGFDVCVLVDVHAGADRHPLGQIILRSRHSHSDQRLGIGTHILSQLVADRRQRAFVSQVKEQLHRSE